MGTIELYQSRHKRLFSGNRFDAQGLIQLSEEAIRGQVRAGVAAKFEHLIRIDSLNILCDGDNPLFAR